MTSHYMNMFLDDVTELEQDIQVVLLRGQCHDHQLRSEQA